MRQLRQLALLLMLGLLVTSLSLAAPTIKEAKADPATVTVGQTLTITALFDDPAGEVGGARVSVQEYTGLALPMQQGEGGRWTFALPIPEAPAGTYHMVVTPLGKDGKPFQVDGNDLQAVLAVAIKGKEVTSTVSEAELVAAAQPWRTEAQLAKVPRRKAGQTFTFVVMGDSRSNPDIFAQALELAAKQKADFSLHTGDIVPKGLPDEYAFFFQQIKGVTWPFLISPGNHELGPSGGKLYAQLFGKSDYSFDSGDYRFVSLDNANGTVTPEQLSWLEKQLTTPLHKIVFMHCPPVEIPRWSYHAFKVGAEELTKLLSAKKVDRVYCGHIHAFDVAEYGGVKYVLTGGAGAPLHQQMAPGNFNHILAVTAGPTGLKETVYENDGTSFALDTWKVQK